MTDNGQEYEATPDDGAETIPVEPVCHPVGDGDVDTLSGLVGEAVQGLPKRHIFVVLWRDADEDGTQDGLMQWPEDLVTSLDVVAETTGSEQVGPERDLTVDEVEACHSSFVCEEVEDGVECVFVNPCGAAGSELDAAAPAGESGSVTEQQTTRAQGRDTQCFDVVVLHEEFPNDLSAQMCGTNKPKADPDIDS